VFDLLRSYPRKRLQLHVLDMALSVFRRLQGNAPEYLREINFYRATLTEMHAALSKATESGGSVFGPGKTILPDGCANLDAAADQFLAGLAPEDLLAFDQRLQKSITKKFRGLGHVCLKPFEKGPPFRQMLLDKAREFLDAKLDHSDPAAVFFHARKEIGTGELLLGEAYSGAAPLLVPTGGVRPYEMVVLGVPPGAEGDRLVAMGRSAMPHVEMVAAPLPEDICFYREYPQVPLTDLPQMGGPARDAYLQMGTAHPPHTRADVAWTQPPTGT
jgi:hypothetical protein